MLLPLKPLLILYLAPWEKAVVHNLKRSANLINHWEGILECHISSPKSPSCNQATDFLSWYPSLSNCCFVLSSEEWPWQRDSCRHHPSKGCCKRQCPLPQLPKALASCFAARNPHPSQTAERRKGPGRGGEIVKKLFVPKGGTKRKIFQSSLGTV